MDERLLDLYNTELRHLRETAAEFGRDFPKIAGRLSLDLDAKERRVLRSVAPGTIPTPLAESAASAVRALAAAAGVTVHKPSGGSSATRDRLILGIAVLAFLLVLVFPARLVTRRARGAEQ